MILTRCSYCGTVFRVTPEHLRTRNGQVRCGHCDAVFNALDFLEEEEDEAALLKKSFSNHIPAVPVPTLEPAQGQNLLQQQIPEDPYEATYTANGQFSGMTNPMVRRRMAAPFADPANHQAPPPAQSDLPEWGNQRVMPHSALDNGLPGFAKPRPSGPTWPFVLLAIPLCFLLAAQVLYAYRTPLASNSAIFSALYQTLGINVPLPRMTELVAIESTDLQADQVHQQLVLLATLRNQATFNQAWPALELTLMDAGNNVISRRILQSVDYLTTDAPPVLAARSELALRLRMPAEGLNAANYRLYVFYP